MHPLPLLLYIHKRFTCITFVGSFIHVYVFCAYYFTLFAGEPDRPGRERDEYQAPPRERVDIENDARDRERIAANREDEGTECNANVVTQISLICVY